MIGIAAVTASPKFMGFIAGVDPSLKTMADLKDKKVGVTTLGSLTKWMVDRLNQSKLPEGKLPIPGFISHVTNIVEHPELVSWRIGNFVSVVGRENIIAGSDYGFSQSYNHMRVHPSVQWAKLESLVEGARLATRQHWGQCAA